MAITIGICDDNSVQLELLLKYLKHSPLTGGMNIIQSTNPVDFLAKLKDTTPELVFLDVDMGEMSGIELGKKIKELKQDVVIVYVTAHEKYAVEAFQVRAYHYLIKPLTEDRFRQVLDEALAFIEKRDRTKGERQFTVQLKGEMVHLDYKDIYYFEKTGHKIRICGVGRDVSYYGNISQLLGEVEEEFFVQCHQGFIVNVEKVRGYREKILYLDGNHQIPVSRTFSENVKEMLARSLFARKEAP